MPFSPLPMPAIPDADLASFALRHAVRLADRPALVGDRVVTYGELAERAERADTREPVVAIRRAQRRRVRHRAARRAARRRSRHAGQPALHRAGGG